MGSIFTAEDAQENESMGKLQLVHSPAQLGIAQPGELNMSALYLGNGHIHHHIIREI